MLFYWYQLNCYYASCYKKRVFLVIILARCITCNFRLKWLVMRISNIFCNKSFTILVCGYARRIPNCFTKQTIQMDIWFSFPSLLKRRHTWHPMIKDYTNIQLILLRICIYTFNITVRSEKLCYAFKLYVFIYVAPGTF